MSLLDDFAEECVLLEKRHQSDGEGGYITTWQEGITFTNYQALNTSTEAIIAEKQGLSSIYGALVNKNVPIEYGDFFKVKSTGKIFKVTSSPKEKQAPKSASFELKYFTAERTELPQ